ncbi:MAG TPA: glycoside hydrolase family 3 N-terminal domain-containing protein [Pelobium sp.]|nr:glycoside hydrolase family 3 N-terminal domain-containing protein [Pelobium sp.]
MVPSYPNLQSLGYTNIYAPILDVSRDPCWGRVVETYGESPFHIAELGKQMTLVYRKTVLLLP